MPDFDIRAARPGDVIVVPFPYSDRFSEKRRPALIISGESLHGRFNLVWAVMITSAKNTRWDCDVEISDLKASGLTAPSVVRPAKIACLEPGRIIRGAGALKAQDLQKVRAQIAYFTGENP